MAKEIQALAATGQTLYAQVFRVTDGAIWNTAGTPAFETYATANIADYDIAMAEAGTASGYYTGNLPALVAGTYSVVVRVRAGGAPAETDIPVSVGTIHWDGSAVIDVASVYSRLGAPAGASIAADLVTIDNFVDDLEGRLTATRAGYIDNLSAGAVATASSIAALNNISTAQVNAEVDTALADINLDHLVKIAVDTDFATTVHLNSVIGHLADNGTSATFDRTTDSLEAIRDRGDAAWITATGFSTHSAADVWAVATRVLTAGTNIQLPSNGLANVTAWTVDITGSLSGSVGSVTGAVGSVTGNVGGNVTGSVGSVASGGITAASIATDAIDADAIAASAVTEIQSGLATSASISALNNLSSAQAQTAAEAALVTHRLDELLNADSDIDGAAPPTVGSVFHELMTKTTGSFTFDQTTDSLEAIRDRGDAAWVTGSGTSTLTQADVRTAVGLASANLDTQLDALPTNAELATALDSADDAMLAQIALVKAQTDLLPASPAAVGSAMTLTSGERDSIAAAILDLAAGVETNLTPRQLLRLLAAVIAGKSSGGGGTYRDYNDTKNRIVATLDGSSNRTAVTRDVS